MKPIQYYIRILHRDLGFFVVGLTIVYAFSGFVLTYRDKDFLKSEIKIQTTLQPNLQLNELERALRIRDLKVEKAEGDFIVFKEGNYNKTTGLVEYTKKDYPEWLRKLNDFHKTSSRSFMHWLTTVYAVLLTFMAISSFWMFKPSSSFFRRGLIISALGALFTIALLFFI